MKRRMQLLNKIVVSERTYVVLLAALLISLPLSYGFGTGILITLLAASLVSARFHKIHFRRGYLAPMLLYGLMIVSLFWTSSTHNSLRGLERQLAMIIIPMAFILMPEISMRSRNSILYAFSIGLSIFALFFFALAGVDYLEAGNVNRFFYHALVSPLELNAIYISVLVSLSGLFLLFVQRKTAIVICLLIVHAIFLVLLASKIIIVITA